MNKLQKAREYTSPIIEALHKRTDPVRYRRTEKQMMLAVKIDNAIKEKFVSKVAFAENIGKKPSEITKWLSGFHNFTINTLMDLEDSLGIEIISIDVKPIIIMGFHLEVSLIQPTLSHSYPSNEYKNYHNPQNYTVSDPKVTYNLIKK